MYHVGCKMVNYFENGIFITSVLHLITISFERYFKPVLGHADLRTVGEHWMLRTKTKGLFLLTVMFQAELGWGGEMDTTGKNTYLAGRSTKIH